MNGFETPHKKILLTAFEPFDGDKLNSSWESIKNYHLSDEFSDCTVVCLELPCEFSTVMERLERAMDSFAPNIVISFGQATGQDSIKLERVALNIDDASIEDNLGEKPTDRAIKPEGPTAYFSTLPIKAIGALLTDHDIPAKISNTAGTFVCNHVFYGLMHHLRSRTDVRAGFVHLPCIPEQTQETDSDPNIALDVLRKSVPLIISACLAEWEDLSDAEVEAP